MNLQYPDAGPNAKHPFRGRLISAYEHRLRMLGLLLRVKEARKTLVPKRIKGQPRMLTSAESRQPEVKLPQPDAVKPVVTS